MRGLGWMAVLAFMAICPQGLPADGDSVAVHEKVLKEARNWPGVIGSHLGVTRRGTRIPCVYHQEDLDPHTKKTRVLLVSGFEKGAGSEAVLAALRWFYTSEDARPFRKRFVLSAVPWVNPDDVSPPRFPPKGEAYFSRQNAEAESLWRWAGMQAPDLIVAVTWGEAEQWKTSADKNHPAANLVEALKAGKASAVETPAAPLDFVKAVMASAPADVGTIPAVLAVRKTEESRPEAFLQELFRAVASAKFSGPSPARKERQNRIERTPLEIAKQLSQVYGHELSSVQYIPALALVGRLRLGELTDDPSHRADVERIVAPYVTGEKRSLSEKFSGSHLAGHLIFAELARTTKNREQAGRYRELARQAAEVGFDAMGQMKQAMPTHNEMSDAVFMACPILVEAGVLTGEDKYLKMADRHFAFMRERVLRPDGIYRHSPLCEAAWGRGNGFPALGLAWCLSRLPEDHPLFRSFLTEFQSHIEALAKHQDPTGMWRQVIDDEGSYRELTATSMITFAMIRGVRKGWLDETVYRPGIEKAFQAIKTRIAEDGSLVDVCTGTGKQKTLRDYYDRKAILGRDARGGAMALLVTTEMARWQKGNDQ